MSSLKVTLVSYSGAQRNPSTEANMAKETEEMSAKRRKMMELILTLAHSVCRMSFPVFVVAVAETRSFNWESNFREIIVFIIILVSGWIVYKSCQQTNGKSFKDGSFNCWWCPRSDWCWQTLNLRMDDWIMMLMIVVYFRFYSAVLMSSHCAIQSSARSLIADWRCVGESINLCLRFATRSMTISYDACIREKRNGKRKSSEWLASVGVAAQFILIKNVINLLVVTCCAFVALIIKPS